MNSMFKAGLAVTAVAAAAFATASFANAGGLYDRGGSLKDTYKPHHTGSAGKCYLRGDVGYSFGDSTDMTVSSPNYTSNEVVSADLDGAWMGEIGIGCGHGASHGFRADVTLGYHGDRDVDGIKTDRPGVHFPASLSSKLNSLTVMANLYYDLGKYNKITPYVGVGLGFARHDLDSVTFDFSGFPATNRFQTINGSQETNFAWSLMAGFGYEWSQRTTLDFGYRYIDMGDVSTTGNICNTCVVGGSRDTFRTDVDAHEIKVGLRYSFGGGHTKSYK